MCDLHYAGVSIGGVVGIPIFRVLRRACKSGTGRVARLSCLVFLFATWGPRPAFSQDYIPREGTLAPYGSNTTTENTTTENERLPHR